MLNAILWLVAGAVAIATALPQTSSVRWWVRMWDFPRPQIAFVAAVTLAVAIPAQVSLKLMLIFGMSVCIIFQLVRIYPYLPFARKEVELVPASAGQVSLMAANVLKENTRYADLIRLIECEDPDVLFLMETDALWHSALEETLKKYPNVKVHQTDDHYGLIFATRLDVIEIELMWPKEDDTAAVKAGLKSHDGTAFNFVGLHPRPPVPGNDTIGRDDQIKKAAHMASSSDRPTVCMGDFNDVAWSWTTQRFKRYGGFLEPRVGRGMMSSFHADYWFLRLPIDQLYVTRSVGLVSFGRLESFGSDHFAMTAQVVFDSDGAPKS